MTLSARDRRAELLAPYAPDHERSQTRRMESGIMPKELPGLLRWYEQACSLEMPDRLHVQGVWRDRVTEAEAKEGIQPVGGSDMGTPAYSEPFRKRIENSPSEVDVDGYYMRPVASALARIARNGRPLMARTLLAVAMAGFDWRPVADRGRWAHEMFEDYLREALIRLWREHRDRSSRLD